MKLLENEGLLRPEGAPNGHHQRESGGNTVMRDAVAVVTHESSANGESRQPGTDLFIQMSAIESIGRAGLHVLMVRRIAPSDVLRSLAAERPRGVVLLRRVLDSNPAREALDELRAAGAAVVMYGELAELRDFDSVVSDHDAGSYLLTKWLLGQGSGRILRFWQFSADTDYAGVAGMAHESRFGIRARDGEANIEPTRPSCIRIRSRRQYRGKLQDLHAPVRGTVDALSLSTSVG